jgi:hypothetical protein
MDHFIQVPLHVPDMRVLATQRIAQGDWLIRVESPLVGTRVVAVGGRVAPCMDGMLACAFALSLCSTCPSASRVGPHGLKARPVRATPRRRHGAWGTRGEAPTRQRTSHGPCAG